MAAAPKPKTLALNKVEFTLQESMKARRGLNG